MACNSVLKKNQKKKSDPPTETQHLWTFNVHWPIIDLGIVLFLLLGCVWLAVVTAHRRFSFELGCFLPVQLKISYNRATCYYIRNILNEIP